MRKAIYCASMIVITTCATANPRPQASAPLLRVDCNDRGCSAAAPGAAPVATLRRVPVSRRGYARTYSRSPRRLAAGATPRRVRLAQPTQPTWERPAAEPRLESIGEPMTQRMTERPREPIARRAVAHRGGVVTIETAANPITVASGIAGAMRDLIGDLVAHGFRGHVTCLASGHMPHSLHHSGEACDFAQLRRNVVAPGAGVMYHASDIIAAHGLRDGCSFRDCGHVDNGPMLSARAQWIPEAQHVRHYARRYLHHRGYRLAHRG
jgi:hypothetical protein